jgi:HD-GYP domain-containing protein (c-di-GMP phosphodiesterase class II)
MNCKLSEKELATLEIGALLHDIGKVAIPQNVIEKPGKLNAEEWRIMKMHPAIGAKLLREIPGNSAESDIVLCHHERFDGLGYPNGLCGSKIPLGSRIFSVADALNAICSDRPYRQAASIDIARREIDSMSGSQFDPAVVMSFRLVTHSEIETVRNSFADRLAAA